MNKYEIMFVVRPDMEEAEIRKTAHNIKKRIQEELGYSRVNVVI